jgi:Protein of unknown function (DUF2793)
MSDTPLMALPLLEAAQAQKHVTHNEALLALDALLHLAVISRVISTPPATPADGDRYLVAAGASGEWLGHVGQIAYREAGSWRFAVVKTGWRLWVASENLLLVYDGTTWRDVQGAPSLQNVPLIGVNTTADATNKLAVSSPSVLFNHAGNDQRLKINKNAAGDTASLVFQDGFSGRAEIGLTGDDDFHVKVSADGSTFFESLWISRASGVVTAKNGFVLDPASGDPAAPINGQVWYNSTLGKFRKRQAGVSSDLDTTGGGAAWIAVTVTLPSGAGVYEWRQTITNAGVTPASVIPLKTAPVLDTDYLEYDPEFTDITSMTALPQAGSFDVIFTFRELHSGPINLQYQVN